MKESISHKGELALFFAWGTKINQHSPIRKVGKKEGEKMKMGKFFNEFDPMIEFATKQQESDVWRKCYTKEVTIKPLANCPICIDSIIEDNNISGSNEAVIEAMADTQLLATFPLNGNRTAPVKYTAVRSIRERAGLNGPAFNILGSEDTANILNTCLKEWNGYSLVLYRDDMVTAVHSGNEGDYSVLPMGDLLSELKLGLQESFGDDSVNFISGYSDDEITIASLEISSRACEKPFEKAIESIGYDSKDAKIMLRFSSSDVALSGANIVPMLKINDNLLQIGERLSVTHKNKHSVDDFAKNVSLTFAMFKEAGERIAKMQQVQIKHPIGCIKAVAKKLGIAKKWVVEKENSVCEMLNCDGVTSESNAFELYYYLWGIIGEMKSSNATPLEIFNMQENLARSLFLDWEVFDHETDW